jgi:hypothetical protein
MGPAAIARDRIIARLGEGGMGAPVSTDGGESPSWARNARELLLFGGNDRAMVSTCTTKGEELNRKVS